jgi:hypothetical protein
MQCPLVLKSLLFSLALFHAVLPVALSSSEVDSVSPDGVRFYKCEDERSSSEGCYSFWLKSIWKGDSQGWRTGYCPGDSRGFLCYQGGVAWWYWKSGKIGDPILKGFFHRDYQSPGDDTYLGDAILVSKENFCYLAAGRTFCMKPMNILGAKAK